MNRPSFVNCILFSLFHFGPISLFDLGGQKSYSFIDDWICFDFWNFCFFWRSLSAGLSTALSQLLRPESAEIIMNDLLSNSVAHWVLLSENLFYSLLRTCKEPWRKPKPISHYLSSQLSNTETAPKLEKNLKGGIQDHSTCNSLYR